MQSTDIEDGIWAVVHANTRKYIGRVLPPSNSGATDVSPLDTARKGEPLHLNPAFELHTGLTAINTPQGPAMSHIVQVLPVDGAVESADIWVFPSALHLFSTMQRADVERHKKLVMGFLDQVRAQRAAASGLTLAKSIPEGGAGGRFRTS